MPRYETARIGDVDLETRIGDVDLEWGAPFAPGRGSAQQFEQDQEIIGPDTRVRTTATTDAPFRYICCLEFDVPGIGRRAIGTGTLVGPRTVLTAAHCVMNCTTRAPLAASRMRVVPGRSGSLEPLPATTATTFVFPTGAACVSPTDFALIHLADPIGETIGFWSRTYRRTPVDPVGTSITVGQLPLPAGKIQVNLSGYPADQPSAASFGCRDPRRPRSRCFHSLLSNPGRSPLCGTFQWRSYDQTVLLSAGMLHYLNDTCPGHSGSPVWVRRDPSMGGRVLVGVHVAGDDGSGTVANRAVFITGAVSAFLRANTR